MEPNHSAYHQHFSTETSVLKVHADILKAMDKWEITCLILLDLSAVFDTIDHEILLKRLKKRSGIRGTVNKWIESYLTKSIPTCHPWRCEHQWGYLRSYKGCPGYTSGLSSWPHLVHTLHKSS